MRILVVEDESKLALHLKKGLEENHYEVDVAYDGLSAEKLASQYSYDLFILDLIIPLLSGLDLCVRLKKQHPHTPVLMLTALGTTEDKLHGFDAGADDYLLKPFEFRELLARVKVLLKRSVTLHEAGKKIIVADLELDIERKTAFRGGIQVKLTAKEFMLLEYLMKNKGRVLSRDDIAEKVWDIRFDSGTNVVDVYINILRKKIDRNFENKLIHTRFGLGYVMEEQ